MSEDIRSKRDFLWIDITRPVPVCKYELAEKADRLVNIHPYGLCLLTTVTSGRVGFGSSPPKTQEAVFVHD